MSRRRCGASARLIVLAMLVGLITVQVLVFYGGLSQESEAQKERLERNAKLSRPVSVVTTTASPPATTTTTPTIAGNEVHDKGEDEHTRNETETNREVHTVTSPAPSTKADVETDLPADLLGSGSDTPKRRKLEAALRALLANRTNEGISVGEIVEEPEEGATNATVANGRPAFSRPPRPSVNPDDLLQASGYGKFTILMLVYNPEDPGFKRVVRNLHASGVNRHPNFYELFVYRPNLNDFDVAREEAATIAEWWKAEEEQLKAVCPEAATKGEATLQQVLRRIRVLPLGRRKGELIPTVYHTRSPYMFIRAVKSIKSDYMLYLDSEWMAYTFPFLSYSVNGTGTSAPQRCEAVLQRRRDYVHSMFNMALQALSNNARPNMPVLINQAATNEVEDVHAVRLQLYASPQMQNLQRQTLLDRRLRAFVQEVQKPGGGNLSDVEVETVPPMNSTTKWVVDGLPVVAYAESQHYHCQRAALYGVDIVVPSSIRNEYRRAQEAQLGGNYQRYSLRPGVSPRPITLLTTMCEAIITGRSHMKDFYVQPSGFFANFCREWSYLTREAKQQDMCSGFCALEWASTMRDVVDGVLFTAPPIAANVTEAPQPRTPVQAFAELALGGEADVVGARHLGQMFFPQHSADKELVKEVRQLMQQRAEAARLRFVVPPRRRDKSRQPEDEHLVCFKSSACSFKVTATMMNVQWFFDKLAVRCLRRPKACMGILEDPKRALDRMEVYLGFTGRWARGDYRMCVTPGVFVNDRMRQLPSDYYADLF